MKLLGGILLTSAASAIGIYMAIQSKRSVRLLGEMLSFLEIMRNEICTRRTPMKQVLCCSNMPKYICLSGFISGIQNELDKLGSKSFTQIWCECADENLLFLSENSRQVIKNLGSSLGRYDAELQAASIDRCICELTAEYEALSGCLKNNEKMYIGLGTGIGLIFSIVLA